MSGKAIGVGDLVMVVHSCCELMATKKKTKLGVPYTVARIEPLSCACEYCGNRISGYHAYFAEGPRSPVPWLKRIDPPKQSDSESTERTKELTI